MGIIDHNSIVEISARAYDTTVARYPEAMLKYLDEDDCDIITARFHLLILRFRHAFADISVGW